MIIDITRITVTAIHPISMNITGGTVIMAIMAIEVIMVGATMAEATLVGAILEEVTVEEVTTGNQNDFELMNAK